MFIYKVKYKYNYHEIKKVKNMRDKNIRSVQLRPPYSLLVTIPIDMARELNINHKDKVKFITEDNKIIMHKIED
jgi:ABC-type lipoprotein release transport system permease subunit